MDLIPQGFKANPGLELANAFSVTPKLQTTRDSALHLFPFVVIMSALLTGLSIQFFNLVRKRAFALGSTTTS